MDEYLALVGHLAVFGKPIPLKRLWTAPVMPNRAMLERVVGLEIPEVVWEFWSHPVQKVGFGPSAIRLLGPGCLFDDRCEFYGDMHIPTSEQIPVMRFFRESRMVLVATPNDDEPLWSAAYLEDEGPAHPFQLSLVGMFESWIEALRTGYVSWHQNELLGPGYGELRPSYEAMEKERELQVGHEWPHPTLRLPYSISQENCGGNPAFDWIFDQMRAAGVTALPDPEWGLPDERVWAQAGERQRRWVEITGAPLPPELRTDSLGRPER